MSQNHISVCACTYKRPELLLKLLDKLQFQNTQGLFTYSVIIVDNDEKGSAESVVRSAQKGPNIEIAYYVEARQGISYARNMCVEKATGDFIAFIDDDEFPGEDWLLNLFNTCTKFNADGVVGIVSPYFEKSPPDWSRRGNLWFKYWGITGTVLTDGSTSNALIKKSVMESEKPPFNPDFGLSGGEDSLFFLKNIKKGAIFVACGEAVVYEFVSVGRMRITYLLKRFFWEGVTTARIFRLVEGISCQLKWFSKSVIAMAAYSVLLPILIFSRYHLFVEYLLKIFYFGGVFLEFLYLSPKSNRMTSGQYVNR